MYYFTIDINTDFQKNSILLTSSSSHKRIRIKMKQFIHSYKFNKPKGKYMFFIFIVPKGCEYALTNNIYRSAWNTNATTFFFITTVLSVLNNVLPSYMNSCSTYRKIYDTGTSRFFKWIWDFFVYITLQIFNLFLSHSFIVVVQIYITSRFNVFTSIAHKLYIIYSFS